MDEHTENTLENIIRARKVRKGKASGITSSGAYWDAWSDGEHPIVAAYGGDGVGNSPADVRVFLKGRHYRCGAVVVGVLRVTWHQNTGHKSHWEPVHALNSATTAEDVVVALSNASLDDAPIRITELGRERIEAFCRSIGMPVSAPSPDDSAS